MSNEVYEDYLSYVTHLRSEHRHLKECLASVDRHWQQRQGVSADSISDLVNSLAKLRVELSHHLAEEESGGCVEEAVVHRPRLGSEAMALEHEDPRLLQQLDDLISSLGTTPKSIEKIEEEYRRLAEQICKHEAAESRILKESFGIEVD